jgi:excinuclease ABC subunit B
MKAAIKETNRRRAIQEAHNEEHGITPMTIQKPIPEAIKVTKAITKDKKKVSKQERRVMIDDLEKEMRKAAKALDFERAATLRDLLIELKGEL